MGNGMDKILPGLYVGNIRDSKDSIQLSENGITHILSIHDNAKPVLPKMKYLCIDAADKPGQDLTAYFSKCNDFIHKARCKGGSVLVHCLAGVSRSVTVTVVYVMTVTHLNWRDALNAVRGARRCANPNFGFQRQLLAYHHEGIEQERNRLFKKFEEKQIPYDDVAECKRLLEIHHNWVLHGDEASGGTERDDGLYPLPLGAYGKKDGAKGAASKDPSTAVPSANLESDEASLGASPCATNDTEGGNGNDIDSDKTTSNLIDEMFAKDKTAAIADILTSEAHLRSHEAVKSECNDSSQGGNCASDMTDRVATTANKLATVAPDNEERSVTEEQTVLEDMFKQTNVR